MTLPKVGFIGMTHLGLNSAVASAKRGVDVICFDNDKNLISSLCCGDTAINEPNLKSMMKENASRLTFTSDISMLDECDFMYVAPDVPTDDNANSDLSDLMTLTLQIDEKVLKAIPLIILSQVPPGFTRGINESTKRDIYYQVETLIFGQAIERALYPERIILGCLDPLQKIHAKFDEYLHIFECPILLMRYESAELTKISINCCLVASVSVANTLAELCEKIGADWSEIVPALKLDKRIGPHAYLSPGLGLSGGNLERDLATVIKLASSNGTDSGVVQAWVKNSTYRKSWTLNILYNEILTKIESPKIAVWGLAYKQDTHSVKNSSSLEFIKYLSPYDITVYDPAVEASVIDYRDIEEAKDALSACNGADVLAIMTPWSEFNAISASAIAKRMQGNIVIDPYKLLDKAESKAAGLKILSLGE